MSDTLAGAIVVLIGVAILWCTRDYVSVRTDFVRWERERFGAVKPRPWWWPGPQFFIQFPTAELVFGYAFGTATIVGGIVVFWL